VFSVETAAPVLPMLFSLNVGCSYAFEVQALNQAGEGLIIYIYTYVKAYAD
jgi:hypothetical protein